MKAITCTRYGPPESLSLKEVERPTPKENEVLVKIHAASLNKADLIMLSGKPFIVRLMGGGFLRPKAIIPGSDMAGRVESVGQAVTRLKPGDEVFGDLASFGQGSLGEFVCASEAALALKPDKVSFEAAAATPMAAGTALQALRDMGEIRPGQKVLIYGASGGVGTFAVQIAKSFGTEVTAVCSARHLDTARSIGADHVIDYKKEDFAKGGRQYDLILGINGYRPIAQYGRVLTPHGIYVMVGGKGTQIAQAVFLRRLMTRKDGKRYRSCSFKPNRQDLEFLGSLLQSGKIVPVIERRFTLGQAAEAYRHIATGHAGSKVVISVGDGDAPQPLNRSQ